jgi:hypothetical protein
MAPQDVSNTGIQETGHTDENFDLGFVHDSKTVCEEVKEKQQSEKASLEAEVNDLSVDA